MQTLRDFADAAWRRLCGLPEHEKPSPTPPLEELRRTQWSLTFERLMRNRLVMGAIRYGLLNGPDKPRYDRVEAIHKRVDLYAETGNVEHLVDVANLALLEFEESTHPNKHFHSADGGEHVRKKDSTRKD